MLKHRRSCAFWLPLLCQQQLALSYLCQPSEDKPLRQARVTRYQL